VKLREFMVLLKKAGSYGETRLSEEELLDTDIKFQHPDGREMESWWPYLVTEDDEAEHPYISIIVDGKGNKS
jgi:hypothetical protein